MKTIVLLFLISASLTLAQDSTKKIVDEGKMQSYFMVFLYRGESWTPERTKETEKIQKGHLENIERLAKDGKIVLAGPFMDDLPMRGIFIFEAASKEEVETLCATDPAIKSQRLRIEIRPWYGPKALKKVNLDYFNN